MEKRNSIMTLKRQPSCREKKTGSMADTYVTKTLMKSKSCWGWLVVGSEVLLIERTMEEQRPETG